MKFISRSLLILLALYGVVFAIGDACLAHARAPVWMAIGFAVAFAGLQYLIAPWIVAWILDIYWVGQKSPQSSRSLGKAQPLGLNSSVGANGVGEIVELPPANLEFIKRLCAERGVKVPRIGLILSGTPNAFSFGHIPANARVVVTSGLLEVLTPEEANAVLAHEIGHIEHWDFAIMGVAALAPLLLYQLYVFTRNIKNVRSIAYTAYFAYLISQFVVLLLNRTREYFADHYAAEVTGAPDVLSSALVKIACGMVRAEGEARRLAKESGGAELRHRRMAGALALMGISNVRSGEALALGGANPAEAAAVMRWDLVNPWARLFEMNSTHPLTAFRVRAMNRQAAAMNRAPQYPLHENEHIGWGTFAIEVFLWAAPMACLFFVMLSVGLNEWLTRYRVHVPGNTISYVAIFAGLTLMLRTWCRYNGEFQPATIGSLIEDVEVSEMHPRAVRLEGEILGRGVPGAFWSPDLVLRDSSGIIFLLHRQSIPLARLLFALTSADEYIGRKVTVEGWFRRTVRPYVEMSSLTGEDGKSRRAYSRWVQYALGLILVVGGWVSLKIL